MQNKEALMTEQESLSIISAMIDRAKDRFSETGTLYLLWGWVIFICCTSQFVLEYFFNYDKAYLIWFLTWMAAIYQVFYLVRKKKKAKVKTYTDEVIGYVWMTFGICLGIVFFILLQLKAFVIINPVILVLYGVPTFLSGKILKFRTLTVGGIISWILALCSVFVFPQFHQLLLSAAVMAAWIIPGLYLRKKYLKENTAHGR